MTGRSAVEVFHAHSLYPLTNQPAHMSAKEAKGIYYRPRANSLANDKITTTMTNSALPRFVP